MASLNRNLHVNVTADSSSLERAFARSERSAASFQKTTRAASKDTDALTKAFKRQESALKAFNGALGQVKFPAMIAGAGAAAQGMATLGAGATAAVSALAPLSGALAAYPALATTAAQGMGVLKLATAGLEDGFAAAKEGGEDWRKWLKDASGPQKQFVKNLRPMIAEIEGLEKVAQRGALPGFSRGVQSASKNLPVLRGIVRDTADAFGDFAEKAGAMVGSKAWGRDLEAQGQRNVRWMRQGGDIALNLADALRHVVMEAGPLVDWMVKGVKSGSEWVEQQAAAGRESGRLAKFFESTRRTMERVVAIGGDLAVAFWNVGKAAKPLGDEILDGLVKSADAFRRWTDSASGKNQIEDYFRKAQPAIFEMGRLIRDTVKAFARLGSGDDLAPLLRMVRIRILPAFETVARTTTEAFGPSLVGAIAEMADLFAKLAGSSGPLVVFVELLTTGLSALNTLLETIPGLNAAVVTVAGGMGLVKALQLGAAVTGVKRLHDLIRRTPSTTALGGGGKGILGKAASRAAPVPVFVTNPGFGGAGTPGVPGAPGRGGGWKLPAGVRAGATVALPVAGTLAAGALAEGVAPRDWKPGDSRRQFESGRAQAIASDGRDADKASKSFDRLRDSIVGVSKAIRSTSIRADIRRNFGNLEKDAKFGDLEKAADRSMRLIAESVGTNTREGRRLAVDNFQQLAKSVHRSIDSGELSVRQGMKLIKRHTVEETADGRRKASEEFRTLAKNTATQMGTTVQHVKDAMRAGNLATIRGGGKIKEALVSALQSLGLSRGQAEAKVTTGTVQNPDDRPNANTFRAGGGWIGQRGQRGTDQVPTMLGVGEAVLNRHQQAVVEGLLGHGFLDKLFSRVRTPHYMAQGGYVPQPRMVQAFAGGGRIPRVTVVSPGATPGRMAQHSVDVDRDAALDIYRRKAREYARRDTGAPKMMGSPGGGGTGTFDGRPVANWIIPILNWARSHGWRGSITSGYRSPEHNAAVGGSPTSNHMSTSYPGGAIDVGGWGARVEGQALASVLAGYGGSRRLLWAGPVIGDWGHFSATGRARGGFIKKFASGGRVSAPHAAALLWKHGLRNQQAAATLAAIAMGESTGNPGAKNLNYPDHSIGLWQINQLAHKGRFGSDAQLTNPDANAKAAIALYRESGFQPWSVYTNGTYRSYLDDAARAFDGGKLKDYWKRRVGIGGTSGGGGSRGAGGGGGGGGSRSVPAGQSPVSGGRSTSQRTTNPINGMLPKAFGNRAIGNVNRIVDRLDADDEDFRNKQIIRGVDPESVQGLQETWGEEAKEAFGLSVAELNLRGAIRAAKRAGNKRLERRLRRRLEQLQREQRAQTANLIGIQGQITDAQSAGVEDAGPSAADMKAAIDALTAEMKASNAMKAQLGARQDGTLVQWVAEALDGRLGYNSTAAMATPGFPGGGVRI